MTTPFPFTCTVTETHRGLTWHSSQLCASHRGPIDEQNVIPVPERSIEAADKLWDEFREVFPELSPRNSAGTASESHLQAFNALVGKLVAEEIEAATRRAAYRSLPQIDAHAINESQRNQQAWQTQEQTIYNLFPYVVEDNTSALQARKEQVDNWGRSLESSRLLISYIFTSTWKLYCMTGINGVFKENKNNLLGYLEQVGNLNAKTIIVPTFGEMLYLNASIVRSVTQKDPRFSTRYAEELLFISEAYREEEKQYQLKVAAEAKLKQEQELLRKQRNKELRGAALSAIGSLGNSMVAKSNRNAEKARQDAEAEHRRIVAQNSRIINQRLIEQENRRHPWTGGQR